MQSAFDKENIVYCVVKNDEDQYSLWPAHKPIPEGWHDQGISGNKEECLEFIERTWIDMTPRSLRQPQA